MGKVFTCNNTTIVSYDKESNIEVPLTNSPLDDIKFDEVIREIKECDTLAFQMRIETYQLKGFNSMTSKIIHSKDNKERKVIDIASLLNEENISSSIYSMGIIEGDVELFQLKDGEDKSKPIEFRKMKIKEPNFDQIFLGETKFNRYGNVNLVSFLWLMNQKMKGFAKELFKRFDIEKGEFEVRLFKNGKEKHLLFDRKFIKDTNFIHPDKRNNWIYLIEKALAKLHRHYINCYNLLWSDIVPIILPAPLIAYSHHSTNRRDLYEIIKDYCSTFICFGERDTFLNEEYQEEAYISLFIVNVFKISSRKYIELFVPLKRSVISMPSNISEEDTANKRFFPDEKMKDERYIFLRFEYYFKYFRATYMSKYIKGYHYEYKRLLLSDRNINLLKFRVPQPPLASSQQHPAKTKVAMTLDLAHPLLFRFVIAKLTIVENYIRRIRTMSSQGNEDSNNSYYTNEIDYDFEYLDSLYQMNHKGIIEGEYEEGIYCLLFNIYTNNEMKVIISSYSSSQIEFLDDPEKISQEKLNSQIKSLFTSFIKKSKATVVKEFKKEDLLEVKTFESLINQSFGYSLYLLHNNTMDKYVCLTLNTETDGMNLITKDYDKANSTDIKLVVPPMNDEIVVFEWEKPIDEVAIFVEPFITQKPIEPLFNEGIFKNIQKKYINKMNVFYTEVQYRRGVFLIFVNESATQQFSIQVRFEKLVNLEYKGIKDMNCGGKGFEFDLQCRSYMSYNLRAMADEDFSYKITLKIHVSSSSRGNSSNNHLKECPNHSMAEKKGVISTN